MRLLEQVEGAKQQCNYVYPTYLDRARTIGPVGCAGCQKDEGHDGPHETYGEKFGFETNQEYWIKYSEYK
jgi:hypothetical protein